MEGGAGDTTGKTGSAIAILVRETVI